MKRIAIAGVGLVLAAPAAALGALSNNTLATEAALSDDGRKATVTALLACDEVQRARLRVTVTQPNRRVVAQGRRKLRCTSEPGEFPVRVRARGGSLAPGAATACALAVTRDDARQWCKEITLAGG